MNRYIALWITFPFSSHNPGEYVPGDPTWALEATPWTGLAWGAFEVWVSLGFGRKSAAIFGFGGEGGAGKINIDSAITFL